MGEREQSAWPQLQVLLPRPTSPEDQFAEALEALGCRLHKIPVLAIEPLLQSQLAQKALLAQLRSADLIIVVSRNAAQLLLELLAEHGESLDQTLPIYAVGRRSAEIFTSADLKIRFPIDDPTSEGLLALRELGDVAGKKIIICRGEGGREKLREELSTRGALVGYGDLYRRRRISDGAPLINDLLVQGVVDLVVIHSGELLDALWAVVDVENRQRLRSIPWLVPGERIAQLAKDRACENLIVAANALPESMVAALVHWYTLPGMGATTPPGN